MNNLFACFAADRSGVMAIEYGLIAGLIAIVIHGRHQSFGQVQCGRRELELTSASLKKGALDSLAPSVT